jgi:hypothetical protein
LCGKSGFDIMPDAEGGMRFAFPPYGYYGYSFPSATWEQVEKNPDALDYFPGRFIFKDNSPERPLPWGTMKPSAKGVT